MSIKLKTLMFTLVSFLLLFVISSVSASANETTKVHLENRNNSYVTSEEFINKFNSSVSMKNNKFVIDYNRLPSNTSRDEIKKLNNVINQSNQTLSRELSITPKKNIVKNNNSLTIVSRNENEQSEQSNEQSLEYRGLIFDNKKPSNGKNFVHTYWWGFRVGISRQNLHRLAIGLNIVGDFPFDKFFPVSWVVSEAISIAGILAGTARYGIVFNVTPNGYVWGVSEQ